MDEDCFDEFSSVMSRVKDGDSCGVNGHGEGHGVGFCGGVVEKHAASWRDEVGHVETGEEERRRKVGKVGPDVLLDISFGVEVCDMGVATLGDFEGALVSDWW